MVRIPKKLLDEAFSFYDQDGALTQVIDNEPWANGYVAVRCYCPTCPPEGEDWVLPIDTVPNNVRARILAEALGVDGR